uniref:Uncharacterized protein n=1 Tax=Zea mays TaxID=4577 RepID=B6SUK6_MAIZE|nr:hypothetical protein [Zea mays]
MPNPFFHLWPTSCTAPLSARSAAVASKFPAPSFSRREQQPRRLRAARCFALRSEQHVVDARQVFAVFAQPQTSTSFTPEEPRVLCGEGKPLDARRCSKRCTNRNHRRS